MRGFGELEAVIMDLIWRRDEPATVREILAELTERRPLAYTTVMTVMDNLRRKGFLRRTPAGRAYTYRPTRSRAEYAATLMRDAMGEGLDKTSTFTHFVARMSGEEAAQLRRVLDEQNDPGLAPREPGADPNPDAR